MTLERSWTVASFCHLSESQFQAAHIQIRETLSIGVMSPRFQRSMALFSVPWVTPGVLHTLRWGFHIAPKASRFLGPFFISLGVCPNSISQRVTRAAVCFLLD